MDEGSDPSLVTDRIDDREAGRALAKRGVVPCFAATLEGASSLRIPCILRDAEYGDERISRFD